LAQHGQHNLRLNETGRRVEQQYINDDVENAFKVVDRLIEDIREVMRVSGQAGTVKVYVGPLSRCMKCSTT
jgi:hypothetical protein